MLCMLPALLAVMKHLAPHPALPCQFPMPLLCLCSQWPSKDTCDPGLLTGYGRLCCSMDVQGLEMHGSESCSPDDFWLSWTQKMNSLQKELGTSFNDSCATTSSLQADRPGPVTSKLSWGRDLWDILGMWCFNGWDCFCFATVGSVRECRLNCRFLLRDSMHTLDNLLDYWPLQTFRLTIRLSRARFITWSVDFYFLARQDFFYGGKA